MSVKLVPLRIPSTWAVIHNSFGAEDPIVNNGSIVNDEYYNEDLLVIERIHFDGEKWATGLNEHILDLGWYPEADPEGCYRFTLIRGNWDNILVTFESKDRQKIKAVIENSLAMITQGIGDEDIERLIKLLHQE
jgi:hypothetical protein